MTVSVLNRTFKGLADLKLRRTSDGALYHLPVPSTFVVDNNIEQRIQYTRTGQGERARASSFVAGREPMLRIVYSHMQPETVQFKIGNEFESKTSTLKFVKSFTVTANDFPAVASGTLGYNVVADAPSQASITRNNISFQLTQVPIGSFDATVADTFAVGANFNVKFSNNLVTAGETLSLQTQESFTYLGIGDNLVGAHSCVATLITTENKVVIFSAPFITPDLSGSGIDPGADQLEIPFFLNNQPGSCFPYEMSWLNVTVAC